MPTPIRDRMLADRAITILRRHKRLMTAPASIDPYASARQGKTTQAKTGKDLDLLYWARERAMAVLALHSLPGHVLNALLRQMDPDGLEQAKKAALEMIAENSTTMTNETP